MFDRDNHATRERDSLIKDYDTVLRESAILTTFAGILFAFLLDTEQAISNDKDTSTISRNNYSNDLIADILSANIVLLYNSSEYHGKTNRI